MAVVVDAVVPPEPDWPVVGAGLPAVLGLLPVPPVAVVVVDDDVGVELAGLPAVGALADMPPLPEAAGVELGDVPVAVPAAVGGSVPAPTPVPMSPLEHATQPKHVSTLQPKRRII